MAWLTIDPAKQPKVTKVSKETMSTSKRSYVVERLMNDWMTDDILVLKALRRKYESLWRKTRLPVHFDMYSESCMDVKTAISNSKSEILQNKISDCNGDQNFFSKLLTPC